MLDLQTSIECKRGSAKRLNGCSDVDRVQRLAILTIDTKERIVFAFNKKLTYFSNYLLFMNI